MSVVLQGLAVVILANSATAMTEVFFEDPASEVVWESKNIASVTLLRGGDVNSVRTTVSWSCQEVDNEDKGFQGHVTFDLHEISKNIKIPVIRYAGRKEGDRDLNITIHTVPGDQNTEILGGAATKILHVIDDACGYHLRIAVFLDSSTSITHQDFYLMKDFAKNLATHFPMAIDRTSIALGQFATTASVLLGFGEAASYERPHFEGVLSTMWFTGGTTRIDRALVTAAALFQSVQNDSQVSPHHGLQPTKILLLVTDGRAPYDIDPYTPIQLELQRRLQVEIMAVGTRRPEIWTHPDRELRAISAGKEGNVFYMDNLADLVQKIKLEGKSYCQ